MHQTASELIHDDHLVILDDVIAIALEEDVGAEGVIQIGSQSKILWRVQIVNPQPVFYVGDALLGQGQLFFFLPDKIAYLQMLQPLK